VLRCTSTSLWRAVERHRNRGLIAMSGIDGEDLIYLKKEFQCRQGAMDNQSQGKKLKITIEQSCVFDRVTNCTSLTVGRSVALRHCAESLASAISRPAFTIQTPHRLAVSRHISAAVTGVRLRSATYVRRCSGGDILRDVSAVSYLLAESYGNSNVAFGSI
jgi:hypothetical protein